MGKELELDEKLAETRCQGRGKGGKEDQDCSEWTALRLP